MVKFEDIWKKIANVTHVTKPATHVTLYILAHNCKSNGLIEVSKVNFSGGTSNTPVKLYFNLIIPYNSQSFECETRDPHFFTFSDITHVKLTLSTITTP